jgi:nucleoside-diphosphate-sugar epimerase
MIVRILVLLKKERDRREKMKVLFIGGTGVISSACTQLGVERGIEVILMNRGNAQRPVTQDVRVIHADIRDEKSVEAALDNQTFDVVVDWVAFEPRHVEFDIELFQGRIGQYIFISSASAYQKPSTILPITESTPLSNPFWRYSRSKIACEERLFKAYQADQFPVTIVRPSHTYDKTLFPIHGGYTVIDRIRKGKKIVVHGDGTSLWTLTHHRDFAVGLIGLLGNPLAIGHAFHITSDEWLTWNQIYKMLANAAGLDIDIVHVPSETIASYDPEWGASLLGDKAFSTIFDNSKIKRFVPEYSAKIPFAVGANEIISWHEHNSNWQVINQKFDSLLDLIVTAQEKANLD